MGASSEIARRERGGAPAERARPHSAGLPAEGGHAGVAGDAPGAPVSAREFALFQRLIHVEAGIWLAPAKKALLAGRLSKRLRELGLPSLGAYHERVLADPAEKIRMLDAICTNETHFFREPRHFEFLAERVFPTWRAEADAGGRPRRVRVWSAACSTGEEPYSIAMALLDAFPSGWTLDVLGTDLSTKVLERARAATWPIAKAEELPDAARKRYMLRGFGANEGIMKAGPELRALVSLERVNLVGEAWPDGPFDLVFCRNVLIYFDREAKTRVVTRLLERVDERGFLFVGHAESLSGLPRARAVLPTVYAPVRDARSA